MIWLSIPIESKRHVLLSWLQLEDGQSVEARVEVEEKKTQQQQRCAMASQWPKGRLNYLRSATSQL